MKIIRILSSLVIIIFVLSSTQTPGDAVEGLYYYEDFEFSFDTATDPDGFYSEEGFTARGYKSETDRIMTRPNAAHQGELGLSIKSHFLESRPLTFTVSTIMNVTIEQDTILSLWVFEVIGETCMRVTIYDGLFDFINIDYIGPSWNSWEEGSNIYDIDSVVTQKEWYHIERNITDDVYTAMKTIGRPFDIFEPKFVTVITFFQGGTDSENEFYIDAIAIGKESILDNLFTDNNEGNEGFIPLYLYVWVLPVFVLLRRKLT